MNKHAKRTVLVAGTCLSVMVAGFPGTLAASTGTMIAAQQTKSISGTIVDSNGIPVIGANVLEKGTTNGTITDIDGNFSLSVSSSKAILVVSFFGYKSVELSASDKKLNEIVLKEDTEMLDEVVVVGYGAVKKSDLTGAVASVSTKELTAAGISSAAGAMQGVVPGVNIQRSSNKPGSGYNILIRGLNTVSGSTKPLIVIDGVPGAELENINPDDIEKIDILKDASSTANNGSKAPPGAAAQRPLCAESRRAAVGHAACRSQYAAVASLVAGCPALRQQLLYQLLCDLALHLASSLKKAIIIGTL